MKVSINQNQLNETQVMIKGIRLNGPKIIARSLNATVTKGRTLSSKKIREQVNLKAAYVKSKLKLKRATWQRLQASISADSRGLILMNYATGTKGDDFKVKIKKGRAKIVKNAFLTVIYAGGRKIDVIARSDPRTGKLDVLYGPSVSQVFNTVRDDIDTELSNMLEAEADKQLAASLRGY